MFDDNWLYIELFTRRDLPRVALGAQKLSIHSLRAPVGLTISRRQPGLELWSTHLDAAQQLLHIACERNTHRADLTLEQLLLLL